MVTEHKISVPQATKELAIAMIAPNVFEKSFNISRYAIICWFFAEKVSFKPIMSHIKKQCNYQKLHCFYFHFVI